MLIHLRYGTGTGILPGTRYGTDSDQNGGVSTSEHLRMIGLRSQCNTNK